MAMIGRLGWRPWSPIYAADAKPGAEAASPQLFKAWCFFLAARLGSTRLDHIHKVSVLGDYFD
jgi:hypothetical protein